LIGTDGVIAVDEGGGLIAVDERGVEFSSAVHDVPLSVRLGPVEMLALKRLAAVHGIVDSKALRMALRRGLVDLLSREDAVGAAAAREQTAAEGEQTAAAAFKSRMQYHESHQAPRLLARCIRMSSSAETHLRQPEAGE